MLAIIDRPLIQSALVELQAMQGTVDAETSYALKVDAAAALWKAKTSTVKRQLAFKAIRSTLGQMCVGPVRCAYCEDSAADEIEHVYPKNLFPERAFKWSNFAFACGPCNGPKSNRFGVVRKGDVVEFKRGRNDPVVPPPKGTCALIDPRTEDPTQYLELDLGGVTQDGTELEATFEFLPRYGLDGLSCNRAAFSIDVLGLNREVLRIARGNAFGGYRARLNEYAQAKGLGVPETRLAQLRRDLLRTPHLTVFFEMRRQRSHLPSIDSLFNQVPEAMDWPLIVPE